MGWGYCSSSHSFQTDDMSWWWTRCVTGNRSYNSLPAATSCDWCGTRGHVQADPRAVILLHQRREGQKLKSEVDGPSAEWTEEAVIEFLDFKCGKESLIFNVFYEFFNAADAFSLASLHTLLNGVVVLTHILISLSARHRWSEINIKPWIVFDHWQRQ